MSADAPQEPPPDPPDPLGDLILEVHIGLHNIADAVLTYYNQRRADRRESHERTEVVHRHLENLLAQAERERR